MEQLSQSAVSLTLILYIYTKINQCVPTSNLFAAFHSELVEKFRRGIYTSSKIREAMNRILYFSFLVVFVAEGLQGMDFFSNKLSGISNQILKNVKS